MDVHTNVIIVVIYQSKMEPRVSIKIETPDELLYKKNGVFMTIRQK